MARNLKSLGTALIAFLIMGAILSSTASALSVKFRSGSSPTTLTGEQIETIKFTVAGQAVQCSLGAFSKTLVGTSVSEITGIVPTYGGCSYGVNSATILMNGCTYTLTGTTDVNAGKELHATVQTVCPAGKHVTIEVPAIKCEITIKAEGAANGSQTATNGALYTNQAGLDIFVDFTAIFKVSHDFTSAEHFLACQNIVGNGIYTGGVTMTGEEDGGLKAHIDIWVE